MLGFVMNFARNLIKLHYIHPKLLNKFCCIYFQYIKVTSQYSSITSMEVRSSQNMTTSYFIIIILFEKTKYRFFFNIQFSENHCLNSKALLNDLLTLTDFNICWKQWFQVENKQKKPYKKIALYNSFVITDNTQMKKVKVCMYHKLLLGVCYFELYSKLNTWKQA